MGRSRECRPAAGALFCLQPLGGRPGKFQLVGEVHPIRSERGHGRYRGDETRLPPEHVCDGGGEILSICSLYCAPMGRRYRIISCTRARSPSPARVTYCSPTAATSHAEVSPSGVWVTNRTASSPRSSLTGSSSRMV